MSGLLLDNPLPLILKVQLLLASELLYFLSCVSLLALWFGHCSGSPQRESSSNIWDCSGRYSNQNVKEVETTRALLHQG